MLELVRYSVMLEFYAGILMLELVRYSVMLEFYAGILMLEFYAGIRAL